MRILIALTYYRPHVSGVTVYAERLARGLARRGHRVTVLTSRFSPALAPRERVGDVDVVRVPVWRKVSKGVIMPAFASWALDLVRDNDVVNIHVPQFEASLLATLGRWSRRGVVLTYHCDLQLPRGWYNRVVQASLFPLNFAAALAAHAIVVNSRDYALGSPFLSRFSAKTHPIAPPIDIPAPRPDDAARLARSAGIEGNVCIGFAARFAAEKGVEYLLAALPRVQEAFPAARIVFTGAYKDTVGEEAYWRRLEPLLERHRDHLTFLPLLRDEDMPGFFSLCDVLAVTSLNSTESFGLVQVEAMMCGTPVVATDLPGVREPVARTGMGRIVPPRDAATLADALIEILGHRAAFVKPRREVEAAFDANRTLSQYEELLADAAR